MLIMVRRIKTTKLVLVYSFACYWIIQIVQFFQVKIEQNLFSENYQLKILSYDNFVNANPYLGIISVLFKAVTIIFLFILIFLMNGKEMKQVLENDCIDG